MNSLKNYFHKNIKRNFVTNYEAYLKKIKVSKDQNKNEEIIASSVFNDPKLQSIFRQRLKKSLEKNKTNSNIDTKPQKNNIENQKLEMISNNENLLKTSKNNILKKDNEQLATTSAIITPLIEDEQTNEKLLYNYRNNILDKEEDDLKIDKKEKLKLSRRIMLNRLKNLGSEVSRRVGENSIFRYNYKLKDFEGHNPLLMRAMSMDNGSVGEIRKGRIYELSQK